MLYSIQSEAVNTCRLQIPYCPVYQFVINFFVIEIYIGSHEVVTIRIGIILIPVDSLEVSPVPFKVGIFILSSRKIIYRRTDHFSFADHLITVSAVKLSGLHFLYLIRSGSAIENNVGVYIYPVLL